MVVSPEDIGILELTVCYNALSNIQAAQQRKLDKYAPLVADLEIRRLSVTFVTLETGYLDTQSSVLGVFPFKWFIICSMVLVACCMHIDNKEGKPSSYTVNWGIFMLCADTGMIVHSLSIFCDQFMIQK